VVVSFRWKTNAWFWYWFKCGVFGNCVPWSIPSSNSFSHPMLFIGVVFSCPNRVNVWCPTNLCWRGCSQIVQCSPQVANCGVVVDGILQKTVVQICDMRWCGVLVVLKNHTMVVWMSMSFSMLACQFSCVGCWGWLDFVGVHFPLISFPFFLFSLSVLCMIVVCFNVCIRYPKCCLLYLSLILLIPIVLHEWSLPCVLILVVS